MKCKMAFSLIVLSLLPACTKEYTSENQPDDAWVEICFRIGPEPEISSFYSTKSIPQDLPPEPDLSKGENGELSFSRIEYAVYDAVEDTLVHHIRFSKEEEASEDFGVFIYDTLKAGDYRICVLTHSVTGVSLTDNILSFPTLHDTFYGRENIRVHINTAEEEKEIILKRIVSRVEFVATDPVPDPVNSICLSVSGRYTKVDFSTGKTIEEPVPYKTERVFTEEERGEDVFNTHGFYTFVPSGNNVRLNQVSLTAKDYDNQDVRERVVKNIPVVANKITRYKGVLYTPGIIDDHFGLIFDSDGQWDKPIEENLPDD